MASLKGSHVIIDGKKLRGKTPKSRGCNGLYTLNTMVLEHGIFISEKRIDDKTNKLTVLPAVLDSICIVGTCATEFGQRRQCIT